MYAPDTYSEDQKNPASAREDGRLIYIYTVSQTSSCRPMLALNRDHKEHAGLVGESNRFMQDLGARNDRTV